MIFGLLTFTLIDTGKGEAIELIPDFFGNFVILPAQDYPQNSSDGKWQDSGVQFCINRTFQ